MIAAQPRRKSNFDTLPKEAWAVAVAAARVGGLSLSAPDIRTQPDQSMPMSIAARVALMTGDRYVSPLVDGPVWDEIERIEPAGSEEVYDITVPTLHNFVANDFIVHNSTYARCGIILQRNAFGTRMGRPRDAGILQHHAAAGENLRERRRGADAVLRIGRSLRNLVQGSRRQIPRPARRDIAEDLNELTYSEELCLAASSVSAI